MHTKLESQIRSGMVFKLIDNFYYNIAHPNVHNMVNKYTCIVVANIIFDHITDNIKRTNRQPYNNVNKQSILNSLLKTGFQK